MDLLQAGYVYRVPVEDGTHRSCPSHLVGPATRRPRMFHVATLNGVPVTASPPARRDTAGAARPLQAHGGLLQSMHGVAGVGAAAVSEEPAQLLAHLGGEEVVEL